MFWPSVSYQRRHEHNVARITSKKVINSEYSKDLAHNWLIGVAGAFSLWFWFSMLFLNRAQLDFKLFLD